MRRAAASAARATAGVFLATSAHRWRSERAAVSGLGRTRSPATDAADARARFHYYAPERRGAHSDGHDGEPRAGRGAAKAAAEPRTHCRHYGHDPTSWNRAAREARAAAEGPNAPMALRLRALTDAREATASLAAASGERNGPNGGAGSSADRSVRSVVADVARLRDRAASWALHARRPARTREIAAATYADAVRFLLFSLLPRASTETERGDNSAAPSASALSAAVASAARGGSDVDVAAACGGDASLATGALFELWRGLPAVAADAARAGSADAAAAEAALRRLTFDALRRFWAVCGADDGGSEGAGADADAALRALPANDAARLLFCVSCAAGGGAVADASADGDAAARAAAAALASLRTALRDAAAVPRPFDAVDCRALKAAVDVVRAALPADASKSPSSTASATWAETASALAFIGERSLRFAAAAQRRAAAALARYRTQRPTDGGCVVAAVAAPTDGSKDAAPNGAYVCDGDGAAASPSPAVPAGDVRAALAAVAALLSDPAFGGVESASASAERRPSRAVRACASSVFALVDATPTEALHAPAALAFLRAWADARFGGGVDAGADSAVDAAAPRRLLRRLAATIAHCSTEERLLCLRLATTPVVSNNGGSDNMGKTETDATDDGAAARDVGDVVAATTAALLGDLRRAQSAVDAGVAADSDSASLAAIVAASVAALARGAWRGRVGVAFWEPLARAALRMPPGGDADAAFGPAAAVALAALASRCKGSGGGRGAATVADAAVVRALLRRAGVTSVAAFVAAAARDAPACDADAIEALAEAVFSAAASERGEA